MWDWFNKWFNFSTEHPVFGSIYTTVTGRSSKWSTIRSNWIEVNPFCVSCEAITNLSVHHIEPFHLNPQKELDLTNLITLCETPSRNCHLIVGHGGNWKTWNPDVRSDAKYIFEMYQTIRKTGK